ncbi:unnamed protein product, partial [Polarella glacialis]
DDIANYKGPVNDSMPAYVRAGFVRKVYFTLSMQLILTFLIAMPFKAFLSPSWVHSHAYLSQVASVIAIAVMIGTMCCCKDATRTYPGNYVFLGYSQGDLLFYSCPFYCYLLLLLSIF